jgi:hypothetical protein
MSDNRREEFIKRLSTVGFGARESVQVMLSNVVYDIREQIVHKRIRDDEMDDVIAFHDEAETLWQDAITTDPPIDPHELHDRLVKLLKRCKGPLAQFERKIDHGVRSVAQLIEEHDKG